MFYNDLHQKHKIFIGSRNFWNLARAGMAAPILKTFLSDMSAPNFFNNKKLKYFVEKKVKFSFAILQNLRIKLVIKSVFHKKQNLKNRINTV